MDDWSLTQDSFEKLLGQLGPTGESAGREYERIRVRLIRYFEWQWFTDAEDLADETMNRVTKALGNGKAIWTKNPISFFYGFARNVAREERGKIRAVSLELIGERDRHLWRSDAPLLEAEEPQDRNYSHLEECVRELPEFERNLIIRYYFGEKTAKIQKRRELASELGISVEALRVRAHRIRTKLEASVAKCADRKAV
jgi:RNA polymerase sigma factor (sigma-70 family)